MSSALISTAGLLALCDQTGKIYAALAEGVDASAQLAQALPALIVTELPGDTDQQFEWYPGAKAIYTPPSLSAITATGAPATTPLSQFGTPGGSLGAGQGLLNRSGMISSALYPWMDRTIRAELNRYGKGLSPSVVDLASFAAAANAASAFSCLFSPSLAEAYFYCYGAQLPPAAVFAPAGILLGHFAITAANAGALTAGNYPTTNDYSSPGPTTDTYGNSIYLGGLHMAQGFASLKQAQAHITTAINGTCTATLTALNQSGATATFTAVLDNALLGATVTFTPTNPGDRIAAAPTACTVSGTATAGAFDLLSLAERSY